MVVLSLALASALVHAVWNVLLARVPRGLVFLGVAHGIGFVVWAPVALARWRLEAGVWPFLIGSAILQFYYFAVLNRAYARAPAHTVYPVARGLGPLLVLLVSVPLTGVGVRWPVIVAVGLISAGVGITATGTVDRHVLAPALPVALSLAAYPLLAAHGLRYADPATYLWLQSAPFTLGVLLLHRRRIRAAVRPAAAVTGIGIVVSGGLTMAALALAEPSQIPAVAALREAGILFVIPLTRPATGEFARRPAYGAVLVFAGVVVLALTGS